MRTITQTLATEVTPARMRKLVRGLSSHPIETVSHLFGRLLGTLVMNQHDIPPDHDVFRWIDWLESRWLCLDEIISMSESWSAMMRTVSPVVKLPDRSPKALVFMLRGPSYFIHLLHNYAVACCLNELGYEVFLVMCGGAERCTVSRESIEGQPPFPCHSCRRVARAFGSAGFEILDLISFSDSVEHQKVEEVTSLSRDSLLNFTVYGVSVFQLLSNSLLWCYSGDVRKLAKPDEDVKPYVRAAVRHMVRFQSLLNQIQPDCLCMFNGLVFPESLFLAQAAVRTIPVVFVERGMRRNTMFVSVNDPACHYRSEVAWEQHEKHIDGFARTRAMDYLQDRMTGPEDPQGTKRSLPGWEADRERCERMRPYRVFFAPVLYDTASMGKADPAGGFLESLTLLCKTAVQFRKKLLIRSHPDELQVTSPAPYTLKQLLTDQGLLDSNYVFCLDSNENWNPYALAASAQAVVVYNGTLGIELPALGYRVFNMAESHYSRKGFTVDLEHVEDFASVFGSEPGPLGIQERDLALNYLYYYIHLANLPCDNFAEEDELFHFASIKTSGQGAQREQFEAIRDRLAMLLGSVRGNGGRKARG